MRWISLASWSCRCETTLAPAAPMRDKLGDDPAKNEQGRDGLDHRDHTRTADRNNVAVTDRSRSHEAEIERASQSPKVGAYRASCLDQAVLAHKSAEPEAGAAQQNRSNPEQKKL